MTTLGQAVRNLSQRRALDVALTNERLTREHVEKLERRIKEAEKALSILINHVGMGFWSRLRWLLRGRP